MRDHVSDHRGSRRRWWSGCGAALVLWCFAVNAQAAPLRQLFDLQTVTFYEQTGSMSAHTFSANSPALLSRLPSLGPSSFDFRGTSIEYYDVFYSTESGDVDPDGEFITIECVFDYDLAGGGLNINEIELNFASGQDQYAIIVTDVVALGGNGYPETASNAVDADLQTWTTLGNTVGQSERLSLTVGFPRVHQVVATQRPDASKFVDVSFELLSPELQIAVGLQISGDAGVTWGIIPTAVWGDFGSAVAPGTGKHIIWNPAVDAPGVSGTDFMVRVVADGTYYADSDVFEIVAAGPGVLSGSVRDTVTGAPVVGASVAVTGQPPVQSGSLGEFTITAVPAGDAELTATHAGYYTVTETITIREDSGTGVDIVMTPDQGFGVTDVRARFCSPSRKGVLSRWHFASTRHSLPRSNGEGLVPRGIVHWIKSPDPNNPIVDRMSGVSTVQRTFDMGTDFGAGGTLAGGRYQRR